MTKNEIRNTLLRLEGELSAGKNALSDACSINDYAELVFADKSANEIWSNALQTALLEHEIVTLPKKETPYYIDNTIVIPSNRMILADREAVIKATPDMDVIMLRNSSTADGTSFPVSNLHKDSNIHIEGGVWEESRTSRAGYGVSGKYDKERSFFGVSACMFFNNIENLTIKNAVFRHCAGFAVQTGDNKNAHFENICFDECFADGLHINGGCENIIVRNIYGKVGDDIVAFNMYDWQNSSVDFGPSKNILCENVTLSSDGAYKAIRIEPGTYYYADGSSVDCSIENAVFKNIRGIKTFKLYYQTPSYRIDEAPEKGDVGSADNIYFEDIEVFLDAPIDNFGVYQAKDIQKGTFAGFELGSKIGCLYFENIKIKLDRNEYPTAYFLCIGPKTNRGGNGIHETFDPGLSSYVKELYLKDICINGERMNDPSEYIKEISFDDIYGDGTAVGKGTIEKIIYQ